MNEAKREEILTKLVAQDLAINLLGDKQERRRAFLGYLTEVERR